MAINTQTETFRGYGKRGTVNAQTAVECRFGQEVGTVLSVHADAVLTGAESGNGEIRYFGKAHFSLVYEDAEKHVCRAEKGVEFTAVAKDEICCPAFTARAKLTVENVSVRREGASVYLTALLGADISLYGEQTFDYLAGGDLVLKREPSNVLSAHLCGGAAEAEDEFETEFIGDILQHAETVNITDTTVSTGTLTVEGEINLGVLALKGSDALASFERLVPFRIEIPCDEAQYGCSAEARVSILNVSIHADADEERGKCKVHAEFTLQAEACVYEEIAVDTVSDAFSQTNQVTLAYTQTECGGIGEMSRVTERISGRCALSSPVDFSDVFQAVTLQRAEANLVKSENGAHVEGVAMATLLVLGTDGTHRGIEMSLPFSVPVQAENCSVNVLVCGMSARQRQEGEIDAEATLKITLCEKRMLSCKFVSNVEEGAELPVNDCAVSVYIPRAGDGLWELAKSLNKSPEEVSASNPDIEFPVREGQRVIVFRRKTLNA
ncbi:MAG: DUF3794 domain-containing protein [Clostridia bacterium]|jgi:hypothetical protein|nr:DUF3794 domain-containing protein [Clostridia bacterium]